MASTLSFIPASIPIVDYASHPGFYGMACDTTRADRIISSGLDRIDHALGALTTWERRLELTEIEEYFQHEVDPYLEQICSACDPHIDPDPLFRDLIHSALRTTRARLHDEASACFQKRLYQRRENSPASRRICEDLHEHGLAVTHLPASEIDAIWELLAPFRDDVLQKRERDPWRSCCLSLPLRGRWWSILRSRLEQCGALAGACDYVCRPYKLSYCALVLSHSRECWYKDCYQDAGLPTPKTTYMHLDEEPDMIKMVVYLREVRAENGPFRCIPGSHLWQRSRARVCFFKQLDQQFALGLPTNDELRNVTYHRKPYKLPRLRRQFMSLPTPLRGTSHFGDDILDGSPLSDYLLRNESAVTSEEGNCMVFHGGMAIHRGGNVQEGERWALQIGLQQLPPVPLPRRVVAGARSTLAQGLRFLLGDGTVRRIKAMLGKTA